MCMRLFCADMCNHFCTSDHHSGPATLVAMDKWVRGWLARLALVITYTLEKLLTSKHMIINTSGYLFILFNTHTVDD